MSSGTGLIVVAIVAAALSHQAPTDYRDRVAKFRQGSAAELTGDNGWLSVVGLCWLQDGQTVGFALDAKGHPVIPCPPSRTALGGFTRSGDKVTLNLTSGSDATVNGQPAQSGPLASDSDKLVVGNVTMVVIRRGARVGIRVFDGQSEARKEFKGQKWFPVDPAYCIQAKYIAYDKPKSMPITNVLGDTQPVPNPGYVEFTLHGKTCRLEAQDAGSGFFFNFSDLTTGKSTYPAGRFLDAPKPVNGFVTLDFNEATNPPCAFTAFATCPLPPSANALKVEVKAGEKTHHPKG